jgi:hypothetical protein
MKVYLSGPIAGQEHAGIPAFEDAANRVRLRGHEPVMPQDVQPPVHDGDCPPSYDHGNGHSAACWMRADIAVLLGCDAVLMLGGWQRSVGAVRELSVATWCGIPVFMSVNTLPLNAGRQPVPPTVNEVPAGEVDLVANLEWQIGHERTTYEAVIEELGRLLTQARGRQSAAEDRAATDFQRLCELKPQLIALRQMLSVDAKPELIVEQARQLMDRKENPVSFNSMAKDLKKYAKKRIAEGVDDVGELAADMVYFATGIEWEEA